MTPFAGCKDTGFMDYEYYMKIALDQAREALSMGEFPVGCILVYEGRVITTGSRLGSGNFPANEIDHAEIIALRRLEEIRDPVDPGRISLFSTMEPCLMCFAAAMIHGIGEIVYAYEDVMGGGTNCARDTMSPLYQNPVRIVAHILREQSLELFQRFFSDPQNRYLKNTLLARYTLEQNIDCKSGTGALSNHNRTDKPC